MHRPCENLAFCPKTARPRKICGVSGICNRRKWPITRPTRKRSSRGHVAPRHAVRAQQERGATSRVNAVQTRGLPIKQKTLSGNALRGHLAKFGLFASKGSAASTRRSPRPRRVRHFQTSPRRPSRQRKIAASASDLRVFESGRDFSAWLGATHRKTRAAARSFGGSPRIKGI
jgi:hypothetical protein